MLLFELFDQSGSNLMDDLRQRILDIITPLIGQKLPFITVQQVIDELRSSNPGIMIDRGLIMDLLNPNTIKAVVKIEGDRIYLQTPPKSREISKKDEEREKEKLQSKVHKKAKENLKKDR